MQDIQSIGNGMGSFFAAGGERRLMRNYHQGSLKCPRCGSLNTKFCYYNNYNLSQPRFFCKGCRRYWTKGGVLRNVPVGGGSRKTKRSKQKTGNGKPSSVSVATTCERKPTGSSQNSSSDSSVAAANISPETTVFTPTEAVPQIFEPPMLNECSTDNRRLFSEIGTFRSLMTSSSDELPLGFISAPEVSPLTQQRDQDEVVENQKWEMDLVDHKRSEFEYSRSSNGGVAAEDWGLFDQSYWLNNPDHHQLNYFL